MTQAANLGALGTNAGTTGILPAAGGGTAGTAGVTGFKNRIINGAMTIDQRNAGASVTAVNGAYNLDRWIASSSNSSVFSVQQSTTAPAGFNNSILITSLASTAIAAGSFYSIQQIIEGYNIADLGFGTANAKTVTLSFWVRSSLTGTFSGCIQNGNVDRSYPFTYTISAANTWEQKSVTIPGDTTGTWNTINNAGIYVLFSLGVGSDRQGTANIWNNANDRAVAGETPLVSTNGATFYITGVQLEVGTAATNFDVRSITTELQLCQRYFQKSYNLETKPATSLSGGDLSLIDAAWSYPTTNSIGNWTGNLPVSMRANPTLTTYDHLGNSGKIGTQDNNGTITNNIAPNYVRASQTQAMVQKYSQSCSGIVFAYTLSAEL
jgi:hypothetical protein